MNKKKTTKTRTYASRQSGNLDIENRNKKINEYKKANYYIAQVILKKEEKAIIQEYLKEKEYSSFSSFFKEAAMKAHPELRKRLKSI